VTKTTGPNIIWHNLL